MRAYVVNAENTDSFLARELPEPELRPHDLLVRVRAVSMNPVDAMVRASRPGAVLGWDAAGEVVAVGEAVQGFSVGQRVFYAGDIQRAGSNAELQAVDARIVGHAPVSLDDAEAAALPLTALTAWEALLEIAGLRGGERVLIINGGGGVGSMAIQLARHAGAEVIATASRPVTRDWVKLLGAHHVVDHRGDLVEAMRGLGAPDVILCAHDPALHFEAMAELIAPGGRIVAILPVQEPLPMARLFAKRASFAWESMFARSSLALDDMARQGQILDAVARLVDQGTIRPTVREVVPMSAEALAEGHRRMQDRSAVGKLVFALEG